MSDRTLFKLESDDLVLLEIVEVDRIRIEIRSTIKPDEHVQIFKQTLPTLIKALQEIEQ